jgi:N4-gp56 family major capsid protein
MAGVTRITDISDEILTVYSRDAILEAQPLFVFRNFVDEKTQLGVEKGETIQFLKLNNIGKGQQLLDEFTPMPRQTMSESTVSITVSEWGNAVVVTRRSATASFRDVLDDATELLGQSYYQTVDDYLRDVFLQTGNVQYAGGVVADGSITSTDVFNTAEIKDAVETLKTLNIPQVRRGGDRFYVCVAHPHQLRKLRDDAAWQRVKEYSDPQDIYNGEVGRYEDVIFIETTQMPITTGAGSGGIDIYSAIMIGDRAVGYAETVPLEIVSDGIQDFGRYISLGWYTIMGAGIINDYLVEIRTA